MKQRILAVLMILCICLSMIPLNVFAGTSEKTNITEWEKSTINGKTYKIEYYHPKGFDKVMIYNITGSSNRRNYHFIYYNDETEFGTTEFYIKNGEVIITSQQKYAEAFEELENNTKSVLFNPNDKVLRNNSFTKYTANNENYKYLGYDKPSDYYYTSLEDEGFETYYANWYFEEYGKYPPLVSENDDTEYMKGNYYAILKQPIKVTQKGAGISFDGKESYTSTKGYVETCEYKEFTADDGTFIYVVISSESTAGDLITFNSEELKFEYLLHNLALITGEGWRNNYSYNDYPGLFYNKQDSLNRYYFANLQDACKFVLYGTEGAKYQHKEIGLTDYGYGYSSCVYSNYEISGFGKKEVPIDSYPIKKAQLILRWHEENTAERPYLLINFDYYPYASIIGADNILKISDKLNPTYKIAYRTEENDAEWDAYNRNIYITTTDYDFPSLQKFPIYSKEKLEETLYATSWDIIFSSYSVYSAEKDSDGIGIDSLDKQEETYTKWTDEDGNIYLENKETGEIFKDGQEDPFIYNEETGLYEDSNGNTLDKNTLTNAMKEWRESIIDYQSALNKISNIIDDFTDIIDDTRGQIKNLTDLLNAFFLNIPSIFRTIIIFTILALIITRITRRK